MEITDSSLKINQPDVILEENNKRKLSSEDDDDTEDLMVEKKICRDSATNFVRHQIFHSRFISVPVCCINLYC